MGLYTGGRTIILSHVKFYDIVEAIKAKIEREISLPRKKQRLPYAGKLLRDKR